MDECRVFECAAPLEQLGLFRDWDYFSSMALSLRNYLYGQGTVPLWNFPLCGGKPELANPQSWAFAWPSLFAYALPPNTALLALWGIMTAVGFFSVRRLLIRWFAPPGVAAACALLFCFNGFFASHFNQGHVSFAMLHLIPLLLLAVENVMAGRHSLPQAVLLVAAPSFLLFTAGSPPALFYFYPVFLIFLVWRTIRPEGKPFKTAVSALAMPLAAHLLGLMLAAYKLWPAVQWQRAHPRSGILPEYLGPWPFLENSLRFIPDYASFQAVDPGRPWQVWEYNWYVGVVPWFLLGNGLWLLGGKRQFFSLREAAYFRFGLVLLFVAMMLVSGNTHWLSPGRLFAELPLLNGIRVLSRFSIMAVFALTITSAAVLSVVCRRHAGVVTLWKGVAVLLLVGPTLFQTGTLVWNIQAVDRRQVQQELQLAPGAAPLTPLYAINREAFESTGWTHQRTFLEAGYWVLACYEPLWKPPVRFGAVDSFLQKLPVTEPSPVSYSLSAQAAIFRFPKAAEGNSVLHLGVPPGISLNVPATVEAGEGRITIDGGQLQRAGYEVEVTVQDPSHRTGFMISGLTASAALLGMIMARVRRRA